MTVNDIDSSTVVFNCSAKGRPGANLTFYNNANEVFSEKETPVDLNNTLQIITTNHEDSSLTLTKCEETGSYVCRANNMVYISTRAEVKVYVTCKYTIKMVDSMPPPW